MALRRKRRPERSALSGSNAQEADSGKSRCEASSAFHYAAPRRPEADVHRSGSIKTRPTVQCADKVGIQSTKKPWPMSSGNIERFGMPLI